MEQLILLVVIGLISLINWAIKKSAQMREQKRIEEATLRGEAPELPSEPEPRAFENSGEDPGERMRKLMEALGLPPTDLPPPLHTEPPRPPLQKKIAPPPAQKIQAPDPPLPVHRARTPKLPKPAASPSPFRQLLTRPESAREAIVLAEILSSPRAIREFSGLSR